MERASKRDMYYSLLRVSGRKAFILHKFIIFLHCTNYISLQILTNWNLPWKIHFKSGMEALRLTHFNFLKSVAIDWGNLTEAFGIMNSNNILKFLNYCSGK